MVSAGITHPIAVVQSTVQTSGGLHSSLSSGSPPSVGPIRSALHRLWNESGPKAFARGSVARMVYMVCSSFSSFEALMSRDRTMLINIYIWPCRSLRISFRCRPMNCSKLTGMFSSYSCTKWILTRLSELFIHQNTHQ